MKLKVLVGAGDKVMGLLLPFAAVGVTANILWPAVFHMAFGRPGLVAGIVTLAVGAPFWLISVAQVLTQVPKRAG